MEPLEGSDFVFVDEGGRVYLRPPIHEKDGGAPWAEDGHEAHPLALDAHDGRVVRERTHLHLRRAAHGTLTPMSLSSQGIVTVQAEMFALRVARLIMERDAMQMGTRFHFVLHDMDLREAQRPYYRDDNMVQAAAATVRWDA